MAGIGRALTPRVLGLVKDVTSIGLSPAPVEQQFEIIRQIYQPGITIFVLEHHASLGISIAPR